MFLGRLTTSRLLLYLLMNVYIIICQVGIFWGGGRVEGFNRGTLLAAYTN